MLNKKISLSFIACLFGMLFVTTVVADNLSDKHVYSFFTETLNGTALDCHRDYDNVGISVWNGGGDAEPFYPKAYENPKEGIEYYSFTCVGNSGGWSGWCYTFFNSSNVATYRDISAFSTLEFYIRPKTGDVSNIGFGITEYVTNTDRTKTLASLGVDNSVKNWQKVVVNLSDLGATDLTKIKNVFLFITSKVTATFDVDYMVMKKSSAGSFDVKIRNISDNSEANSIEWDADTVYKNGWKAAKQYLDFSLDVDTVGAWSIRIYTNNNSETGKQAGLVCGDSVLPMCWRIDKELIPHTGATLDIAQGGAPDYGLYDHGVSSTDPNYYPWFYFKDAIDVPSLTGDALEYVIAWDYRGIHGAVGLDEHGNKNFWNMKDSQFSGIYPKLYLGADFDKAWAGTYSANIKIELKYDD